MTPEEKATRLEELNQRLITDNGFDNFTKEEVILLLEEVKRERIDRDPELAKSIYSRMQKNHVKKLL